MDVTKPRKFAGSGDIHGPKPYEFVVALWEVFYIGNERFDLDTLRVLNRSPTPTSKFNDFPGQSDDIWEARAPHFRPIWGLPGVRAGLKNTYFLAL